MSRKVQPVGPRFLAKFRKTESCWLWFAAKTQGGYGKFWDGKKQIDAHRFAYKFFIGEIPDKLHVLHKCDVRNCVNPNHLWVGTAKDNIGDAITKKRWDPNQGTAPAIHRAKTHCPYGHEYTPENTYITKTKQGFGRYCKACRRINGGGRASNNGSR